jgi:hypothetical protein
MGWRVKSEAETMFGKDTFWVRKDMVNDLIGYRAAGVSDAWTGITRWSPEMQRGFKEVGMVLFGTKAYRYMSTAEGAIEDVMSAVKTTIIVRSIVVMRDNLTANLLQLHMNGMSLPEIGKKMISKFLEITEYVACHLKSGLPYGMVVGPLGGCRDAPKRPRNPADADRQGCTIFNPLRLCCTGRER